MKTYRAAMSAMGLARGQEFSSDDPGWDKFVEKGVLVVVLTEDPEGESDDESSGESGQGLDFGGEEDFAAEGR